MAKTVEELMDLSDEDFLKMNSNGELEGASAPSNAVEQVTETQGATEEVVDATTPADPVPGSGGSEQPNVPDEQEVSEEAAQASDGGDPVSGEQGKETPAGEENQSTAAVTAPAEEPVDYEKLYKAITAPFKANGREFKVNSPEEVVRLMQQGAGAGKKMAQLAPNLRILKTLENNGLLDEGKLSFLIDINKKNPEAIKKLLQDNGINPLDINTDEPAQYVPVNHTASNEEVLFHETLEQVSSNYSKGRETIHLVNKTWDSESIAEVWKDPQILKDIAEQRESGVYDLITSRVERMQVLGEIPYGTPFLRAYKFAGDQLVRERQPSQGTQTQSAQLDQAAPTQQPIQPRVLDQRAAAPKTKVSNNDRASALGAPPRSPSTKPRQSVENIFNLSDEEFMKTFHGRI